MILKSFLTISFEFFNSNVGRKTPFGVGSLQIQHKLFCLELMRPCMLTVDVAKMSVSTDMELIEMGFEVTQKETSLSAFSIGKV